MWSSLTFGSVIFHAQFPFKDGAPKPKILVVLGIRGTERALVALTTSRAPDPPISPGCSANRGLFLAQRLPRDCLEKDTYIQLWRLGDLLPAHTETEGWKTHAKVIGVLSPHTAGAIKNCAAQTDDISARRRALLGLSAQPATPTANAVRLPDKGLSN